MGTQETSHLEVYAMSPYCGQSPAASPRALRPVSPSLPQDPPRRPACVQGRGCSLRWSHPQPDRCPPRSDAGTSYTAPPPRGTSLWARCPRASVTAATQERSFQNACLLPHPTPLHPRPAHDRGPRVPSSDPDCHSLTTQPSANCSTRCLSLLGGTPLAKAQSLDCKALLRCCV